MIPIRCLYVRLLIISLFLVACQSEKGHIGTGIIHVEPDEDFELDFYNDFQSTFKHITLSISVSDTTVNSDLKKLDGAVLEEFNPIFKDQKHAVFVFRVLEEHLGWAKVIIDEASLNSMWINLGSLKVESWSDFLPTVFRVRSKNGLSNPLVKSPSNREKLMSDFSLTCFRIHEIQGDWIKIFNQTNLCEDTALAILPIQGFIRWKRGSDILIIFNI
jgi:hypothetical protein